MFSPYCPGVAQTLSIVPGTSTVGTNANWAWYNGATLLGTGTTVSVSPTTNTTYTARLEGLCNTTTTIEYTVNIKTLSDIASATITASVNPVCANTPITLQYHVNSAVVGTGAHWIWYDAEGGNVLVARMLQFRLLLQQLLHIMSVLKAIAIQLVMLQS